MLYNLALTPILFQRCIPGVCMRGMNPAHFPAQALAFSLIRMPFEPVILFFIAGLSAGPIRPDLKSPGVLHESPSHFPLLAIGLKGGVELARFALADLLGPAHRRTPEKSLLRKLWNAHLSA